MTDTATIEALLVRLDECRTYGYMPAATRSAIDQAASTIRALSAENEQYKAMIETGAHKV